MPGWKVSDLMVQHLKSAEGFCAKAYKCPGGVWTIGFGTTQPDGHAVTSGMTCTQEQAERWLRKDLQYFENGVNKYSAVNTQGKFDACVDFAYNCGLGRLQSAIAPILGQGDATVCNKFRKYVYAKGKKLSGLVNRREWECARYKGENVPANYSVPVNQSSVDTSSTEEAPAYVPPPATAEATGDMFQSYNGGDFNITMVDEFGDDFGKTYAVVEDPTANQLTPQATETNEETTKGEGHLPQTLHKEMDNAIENDELTAAAKPEDITSKGGEDNTAQNNVTDGTSDGASAGSLSQMFGESMFQSYNDQDYAVNTTDEMGDTEFNYAKDNGS